MRLVGHMSTELHKNHKNDKNDKNALPPTRNLQAPGSGTIRAALEARVIKSFFHSAQLYKGPAFIKKGNGREVESGRAG